MHSPYLAPLVALIGGSLAQSLTEALSGDEDLSQLARAIGSFPDLETTLSEASNITIFAPNNQAFSQLPDDLSQDIIAAVLTYHVVPGVLKAENFGDTPQFLPTLLDDTRFTNVSGGQVVSVAKNGDKIVINEGMQVSLGGDTVDAAASVEKGDIEFDGGVIHVIDSVLLFPNSLLTLLGIFQDGDQDLSALTQALESASLLGAVASLKDVTVFAPTTAALSSANLTSLNASTVAEALQYHVVNGTVAYSPGLSSGSVRSLQGDNIEIEVEDDQVTVNGARVIQTDILSGNGVVHIIDSVLTPSGVRGNTSSDGESNGDRDAEDDDDEDGSDGDDEDEDAEDNSVGSSAVGISVPWIVVAGLFAQVALLHAL